MCCGRGISIPRLHWVTLVQEVDRIAPQRLKVSLELFDDGTILNGDDTETPGESVISELETSRKGILLANDCSDSGWALADLNHRSPGVPQPRQCVSLLTDMSREL